MLPGASSTSFVGTFIYLFSSRTPLIEESTKDKALGRSARRKNRAPKHSSVLRNSSSSPHRENHMHHFAAKIHVSCDDGAYGAGSRVPQTRISSPRARPIFREAVPLKRRHGLQFMGSTRTSLMPGNRDPVGISHPETSPARYVYISRLYTHTGRAPRSRKNAWLTRITRKSRRFFIPLMEEAFSRNFERAEEHCFRKDSFDPFE